LFTPNALKVKLVTFNDLEDSAGTEYDMIKDSNGVWETTLDGELYGLFYGYKVTQKNNTYSKNVVCIDLMQKQWQLIMITSVQEDLL